MLILRPMFQRLFQQFEVVAASHLVNRLISKHWNRLHIDNRRFRMHFSFIFSLDLYLYIVSVVVCMCFPEEFCCLCSYTVSFFDLSLERQNFIFYVLWEFFVSCIHLFTPIYLNTTSSLSSILSSILVDKFSSLSESKKLLSRFEQSHTLCVPIRCFISVQAQPVNHKYYERKNYFSVYFSYMMSMSHRMSFCSFLVYFWWLSLFLLFRVFSS